MLTGGCFCGAVRYEAGGEPRDRVLCHCSVCRRTAGAPVMAWFTVDEDAFRFTRGEPSAFRSSERGLRRFCADCGAQLTFQAVPGEIDVTTASLDDPAAAPPEFEIWTDSRIGWIDQAGRLPRYAGRRSSGTSG